MSKTDMVATELFHRSSAREIHGPAEAPQPTIFHDPFRVQPTDRNTSFERAAELAARSRDYEDRPSID